MKKTWFYEWLEHNHQDLSFFGGKYKSGLVENLLNITIVPLMGFSCIIVGLLSSLLLPLYLIKDLYDLYYYLNAEKIAKKEAIKKALKLKNDIKNWINNYQLYLDKYPYLYCLKEIEKKSIKGGIQKK